jgi:SAM-dependent methyltransferase
MRVGRKHLLLFVASFVALYFELVIIRYLATEVRVFAYLKNLPLIASFLGIGLGMVLGRPPKVLKRAFPFIAGTLFLLIAYAHWLNLTHLPFPNADYFVWGTFNQAIVPLVSALQYFGAILGLLALLIGFFIVLGGIVGEQLSLLPPLHGYGVNLAGSLTGIAVFTLIAFLALPPVSWLAIGFLVAFPFFRRERITIIAFAVIIIGLLLAPQTNTYWSPYYRVSLHRLATPPDWPHPSAYELSVNHDYHQRMVDLSARFIARHPEAEPNRSANLNYELPYRLVPTPGEVLVVGAGTGNDVAAALRHGATHIDAVEIDPLILSLGKQFHPERPYDSPRVTVHLDDARAFFKKSNKKYDLVIFGYLDSHTLLTSFSSLRLDNYVYTLESFCEAKGLLKEDGTLVLAFASGATFVTDRLFATLTRAFGVPPQVYRYDSSRVIFVEGEAREAAARLELANLPNITEQLSSRKGTAVLATDTWPFLYLKTRTIPYSILWVLIFFLCGSAVLLRRTLRLPRLMNRQYLHLFLLGAGFLLLETKAVTELSLLFGSTWVVNAVVISAFITMGLLANTIIMFRPISRRVAYSCLFLLLGVGMVFPYALLDTLPTVGKTLAAGILVGLPIFFSGLVFSRSFRDVGQPSEALGVNLLGAVVGGTLENTVMLGGTPILGALAIVLYVLSAIFVKKPPL